MNNHWLSFDPFANTRLKASVANANHRVRKSIDPIPCTLLD